MHFNRILGIASLLLILTSPLTAFAMTDCGGAFGRVLRSPDGGEGGGAGSGGSGTNDSDSRKGHSRRRYSRPGWGDKASEYNFNPGADDPLTRLGLAAGATADEIKKAWRAGTTKFHPDSDPTATPEEKAEKTKKYNRITDAYERLTGKSKKTQTSDRSDAGAGAGATGGFDRGSYFKGTNPKFTDIAFDWAGRNISPLDAVEARAFATLLKRLDPLVAGKKDFKDAFLTTIEAVSHLRSDPALRGLSEGELDSFLKSFAAEFKPGDLTPDDLRKIDKYAGDVFPLAGELAFREDAAKAPDKHVYADLYAAHLLAKDFSKNDFIPEKLDEYAGVTEKLYGGAKTDLYADLATSKNWNSLTGEKRRTVANMILDASLTDAEKVKVLADSADKLASSNPDAAKVYRNAIERYLGDFESRKTDLRMNHPELWARLNKSLGHPSDPLAGATIDKYLGNFPLEDQTRKGGERREYAVRIAKKFRQEIGEIGDIKAAYLEEVGWAAKELGDRAKHGLVHDFFPLFRAQNPTSEQYAALDASLHQGWGADGETVRIADTAYRESLATAKTPAEYIARYREGSERIGLTHSPHRNRKLEPRILIAEIAQKYGVTAREAIGQLANVVDLKQRADRDLISEAISRSDDGSMPRDEKLALYRRLRDAAKADGISGLEIDNLDGHIRSLDQSK